VKYARNATARADAWQDRAACANAPERDKEAFTGAFPTREMAKDLNRRYCSQCPVRAMCFQWAYEEYPFAGVAGGCAFVGERAAGKHRRVIHMGDE
jgi:hypothetical protein